MLAIELPSDIEEMFQAVSRETGRSMKELVQETLDRFLEEWEDRQDAVDAKKALEEYHRNPGQPFTLDDAMVRYELTQEELTTP